jgi:hypothetical protein
LSIGATDDGFEIEKETAAQEITADEYGDSVLDGIYRGGQCFFNLTLLEFAIAGAQRLRRAYQEAGTVEGTMGTIGCTLRHYAFEMTLNRVSPPDASNSPDRYWIPAAILDPAFPVRWTLQSRLWSIPLRIRALPYKSDGTAPAVGEAESILEQPLSFSPNNEYFSTSQQTVWYIPTQI